ncbi:DUF3039 domain-containing protein [Microbacterium sp. GXS0129]|uniref:DUF3039 domain-containing protein n=1 Tax=Microbacterium sp. GXS0129 TaxID=3377836 RepID=UPI00383B6769
MSTTPIIPQNTIDALEEMFNRPTTVNHYVKKADITAGIVHGTPVTAPCGAMFVLRARGGDVAAHGPQTIICPECTAVIKAVAA